MSFASDAEPVRGAEPEPGSLERPLEITDPRMLRALAHPARIAIMQHLGLDGPATATQCAEVAGLSPSACSYHLRALARFGFVEPDPASAADGRHRPWRVRVLSISFGGELGQTGAAQAAGRLLVESLLARFDEIRAKYLDREAEYDLAWRAASGLGQDVLHLTAGELATLRSRLRDLLAAYRRLDPASRPPGARRVNATFDLIPWFDPDNDHTDNDQ